MRRTRYTNRIVPGSALADLDWTDEDLWKVKAEMAQCRMAHNLPLHPQLMRDYCSIADKYKYE